MKETCNIAVCPESIHVAEYINLYLTDECDHMWVIAKLS